MALLAHDGLSRGQWLSFNSTAPGALDWSLQGPQSFWNQGSYSGLSEEVQGGFLLLVIISGIIIDACEKVGTILKEGSYSGAQMKPLREPQAELNE